MEDLIRYLFSRHIMEVKGNIFLEELCKMKPIALAAFRPSQEQLQTIQYLLAKNIVKYSPTHLTITINLQMVLVYQRIYKVKQFVGKEMHREFSGLLEKFVAAQFLPVAFEEKRVRAILGVQRRGEKKKVEKVVEKVEKVEPKGKGKGKGKGKKKEEPEVIVQEPDIMEVEEIPEEIPNSRLFYEYESTVKEGETQYMVNMDELNLFLKWYQVETHLGKERSLELKKQLGTEKKEFYELLHEAARENTARSELTRKILFRVREEKIQEFIFQTFRRYDVEEEEKCSGNCLLLFNLVKKYPLISEKQLSNLSLLPLLAMRKSLNLLVQEGLMHYYPEGIRAMVYRLRQYGQIEDILIDRISQAILNLHILMSSSHIPRQEMLKFETMIWDLDNTLLLFSD